MSRRRLIEKAGSLSIRRGEGVEGGERLDGGCSGLVVTGFQCQSWNVGGICMDGGSCKHTAEQLTILTIGNGPMNLGASFLGGIIQSDVFCGQA